MREEIRLLRQYCRKWGGDLLIVPMNEFESFERKHGVGTEVGDKFFCAPFTVQPLGIHWMKKLIVLGESFNQNNWVEICHEMGHIFACNAPPNAAEEFDFFGWEFLLAKKVGGKKGVRDWFVETADYSVDEGGITDFGHLTPGGQRTLLASRIKHGKKIGIISKKNKLRCIRI